MVSSYQAKFMILVVASIVATIYVMCEYRIYAGNTREKKTVQLTTPDDEETTTTVPTEDPCLRHNITVKFVGRLGNLMFIYAALLGIAKQNKLRPVIHENSELFNYFQLGTKTYSSPFPNSSRIYKEGFSCKYGRDAMALGPDNDTILDGYFQSWKYFEFAEQEVRRNFKFKKHIISTARQIFRRITQGNLHHVPPGDPTVPVTFIGVHIRRGDLTTKKEFIDFGFVTASKQYIVNSFRFMMARHNRTMFVVASDDMKWARTATSEYNNVVYVPNGNKAEVDMAILTLCNHTIITVGSFGWWSAYLAKGDVVYYAHVAQFHSKLAREFDKTTYFPRTWIKLT